VTTQESGVAEEVVPRLTPEVNPRNAAIDEIAARVAEKHVADAVETEELYGDKPAEKETEPELSEESEPEVVETAPVVQAAPVEPDDPMVTVKVNGELRQIPQSELMKVYQTERSATEKFQQAAREREEAARMRAEAEAYARQVAAQQAPISLDDRAIAERIQYGSTDEAAETLTRFRDLTVQQARQEAERVLLNRELQQYQKANSDLFQDPMLYGALVAVEERLANDPEWAATPSERWHEASKRVRERFGVQQSTPTQVQKPVAAVASIDRAERKAQITNVPTASGRRAEPQTPRPPTTSEVIEAERARRMKGRNY